MAMNKGVLIGVLALGGATALFFVMKKPASASKGVVNNPVTVTNEADGTTTVKSGSIITNSSGNVTDKSGNAVNVDTMAAQQRQDLINALNAQNAAVAADPNYTPLTYAVVAGQTTAIASDDYATYLANQAGYVKAGKPPPIQYDNSVPGQVTVIPYADPTHPVTYADPTGTLKFTNIGGVAVPDDPNAQIINSKTPVIDSMRATVNNVPSSGSGNTGSVVTTQITPGITETVINTPAPGQGSVGEGSGGSQTTIFTGGLNTDTPYQIINGVLYYI